MRNMGFSEHCSILVGILVAFENSFLCQARLILLDSFLLFFTALTLLMWTEFQRFKLEFERLT